MTSDAAVISTIKWQRFRLHHRSGSSTSGTAGDVLIFDDTCNMVLRKPSLESDIDPRAFAVYALAGVQFAASAIDCTSVANTFTVRGGFQGFTDGDPLDFMVGSIDDPFPFSKHREAGQLPEAVLERLQYLAELPENWDSDGSAPVGLKTIVRARSILQEAFAAGGGKLPLPSIAPAYDGMLVMEWVSGTGKELTIDIPADSEPPGFLLVEPGPEGKEIETDEELGQKWSTTALIHRLMGT